MLCFLLIWLEYTMALIFLSLFYRADLSRALQLLLYSIEIFSYFS